MIRKVWHRLAPFFRNKYLVTISFFLVWIIFFDQNNLIDRYRLVREVDQLQKDKLYYLKRIDTDSARLEELMSSPANLEKFAREQYLMKKDNEDIFVIVEEE